MAKAKDSQEVAEVTEPHGLDLTKDNLGEVNDSLTGLDFVPRSWDEIADSIGELVIFQGSPYKVVEKKELIGVPFVITDLRFYWSSRYDSPVVAVCCLTQNDDLLVFNDGSTGIFEQCKQMAASSGKKAGIMCPNGLRVSEYKVDVVDGMTDEVKSIEAATYYVA